MTVPVAAGRGGQRGPVPSVSVGVSGPVTDALSVADGMAVSVPSADPESVSSADAESVSSPDAESVSPSGPVSVSLSRSSPVPSEAGRREEEERGRI